MKAAFASARDPLSSESHFLGALFFFITGIALIIKAAMGAQNFRILIAIVIFVLSLVLLYATSAFYHFINTGPEKILFWRKLDHAMIFVLIAGTYTPMCSFYFPGSAGFRYTALMWLAAAAGIILKMFWLQAPRWISTGMYLIMGWIIVFNCGPILQQGTGAFLLLLAGGVFYSVGALVYALKKPDISSAIGFHEIFHLFVILGSLCHFMLVWFYIA